MEKILLDVKIKTQLKLFLFVGPNISSINHIINIRVILLDNFLK